MLRSDAGRHMASLLESADLTAFFAAVEEQGVEYFYSGTSALMIAARLGRRDVLEALLLRGANVNLQHKRHRNCALHYAALEGHLECVSYLLSHNANPNVFNNHRCTPLMSACQEGKEAVAHVLVTAGANALAASERRHTAADYAQIYGHPRLAEKMRLVEQAQREQQRKNFCKEEGAVRTRLDGQPLTMTAPTESQVVCSTRNTEAPCSDPPPAPAVAAQEREAVAQHSPDNPSSPCTTPPASQHHEARHANGRPAFCSLCGEPLRARNQADFLREHSSEGNAYVEEFLHSQALQAMLAHPAGHFHRLLESRTLRKECTESLAVVHRVAALVKDIRARAASSTAPIVIFDLCCGKSLTAVLCAHRFPDNCTIVALDRRPAKFLPHFEALSNVTFVQGNLFEFYAHMDAILQSAGPDATGIVVGMHLCGLLSEKAVSLFTSTPRIYGLVLSPCCIPRATSAPVVARANRLRVDQYDYWCLQLVMALAPARRSLDRDPAILSARNAIIVARK
jgi:hypothetical protein